MNKKCNKLLPIIAFLVLLIYLTIYYIGQPDRVSNEFAKKLFDYPLPNETTLIEQKQFNGRNWIGGGGSGGEWNVVAYMKVNTQLSKREIVNYYSIAGDFPFPNSDKHGVKVEIYFENNRKLVDYREGKYYVTRKGFHQTIDNISSNELEGVSNEVIIQIVSGFKYFQID